MNTSHLQITGKKRAEMVAPNLASKKRKFLKQRTILLPVEKDPFIL